MAMLHSLCPASMNLISRMCDAPPSLSLCLPYRTTLTQDSRASADNLATIVNAATALLGYDKLLSANTLRAVVREDKREEDILKAFERLPQQNFDSPSAAMTSEC